MLGGIRQGSDAIRLATSKEIKKQLFSNPNLTEFSAKQLSKEEASKYLAEFGKYAKKIELDKSHVYDFCNAHGAVQLFDKTANKSVIQAVIKLKHPISNFIKTHLSAIFKK